MGRQEWGREKNVTTICDKRHDNLRHFTTVCMKVLRELCPQNPAWLDVVNILMAQPVLVINPYRNHLAMTYDGLPQGDPLSTLVFSLAMTEVIHKAVRETTSEVKTLSYVDDTVLVGPADDIH